MSDSQPDPPAAEELGRAIPEPDPRRWKALILLSVAAFMVILDAQIVILALPSMETDLNVSPDTGQWFLSAYMLAFGGLLLFGGRLADLRGRRQIFVVGTVLFLVSSALCGLAWSGGVLIGARVVQGVSAALMAPAALAILVSMFAVGPERNKALAVWSSVAGIGATSALLIGGPITDALGWEWIFFINIPVAVGMLAFAPILLPESRDRGQPAYDPAGAVTSTVGLVLLIGAIVWAPIRGWASGPVIGLLLGSAVLIGVFVVVERRSAAPLVPLRIFRARLFVGGNLAMALFAMATVGMSVAVTAYAQRVLGFTAVQFGLSMLAMTLMAVAGALVGQAGISRFGFRPVVAVAAVLMGTGLFLLSQVSVDGTYLADLFPGLLLVGLGLGAGPVAATAGALSAVSEDDAGVASGAVNASFQIGGALGAAVITAVVVSAGGDTTVPAQLTEAFRTGFTADILVTVVCLGVALVLLRPLGRRIDGAPAPAGTLTDADER